MAVARLDELQADLEFAAGSQAGSVGRRLDDVRSEVGSVRAQSRDESIGPLIQLHTDVATEQQITTRGDPTPNLFEDALPSQGGLTSPMTGSPPTGFTQ